MIVLDTHVWIWWVQGEARLPRAAAERIVDCVERGRRGRDQAGLEEAARQFEGDLRAELAAIETGTHPLQQRRSTPR